MQKTTTKIDIKCKWTGKKKWLTLKVNEIYREHVKKTKLLHMN